MSRLLSVFVLPREVQTAGLQEIMGQRASFWSSGSHSYAIVGAVIAAELEEFQRFAKHATD